MTRTITCATGDALFDRVMEPYRAKKAIYLRTLEVVVPEEGSDEPVIGRGTFRIDESSYIDDTGHFNAAEFIMSYNQLMYATIAAVIDEDASPLFAGWSIGDYWERQLPDVLIQEFWSRYSRPINARDYRAEFVLGTRDTSRAERGIIKFDTSVEFTDDTGGRARGTVLLALTNTPAAALELIDDAGRDA